MKLGQSFFAGDTLDVARDLLGKTLAYRGCSGIIVETEAYKTDAASHALTRSKKGAPLRETYGRLYVYMIYGMYYCLNFTTERHGVGAVLIRAVEPVEGVPAMKRRRKTGVLKNLTSGPGKLCRAFGITGALHGELVGRSVRVLSNGMPSPVIASSPRIGISKATDLEWRFFIPGNPYVSRI